MTSFKHLPNKVKEAKAAVEVRLCKSVAGGRDRAEKERKKKNIQREGKKGKEERKLSEKMRLRERKGFDTIERKGRRQRKYRITTMKFYRGAHTLERPAFPLKLAFLWLFDG